MTRRYPVAPLAKLMRRSEYMALDDLGVGGTTARDYRERGVTRRVADSLAGKAGYHVSEIWPEIVDHDIAEFSRACDECGETYVHVHPHQRFCSRPCYRRYHARANARRRRATPEGAAKNRERRRRYYAENADYERARERRRYHANKGNAA